MEPPKLFAFMDWSDRAAALGLQLSRYGTRVFALRRETDGELMADDLTWEQTVTLIEQLEGKGLHPQTLHLVSRKHPPALSLLPAVEPPWSVSLPSFTCFTYRVSPYLPKLHTDSSSCHLLALSPFADNEGRTLKDLLIRLDYAHFPDHDADDPSR